MELAKKSGYQFMLSTEAYNEIASVLRELEAATRAELTFFCDANGIPITHSGKVNDSDLASISTLTAANFAATREIAKTLGEDEGFQFLFLEGKERNMYFGNIGFDYLLTIVFSKSVALGMLRIYANRAVKQLAKILQHAHEKEKASETIIDDEFTALLNNAIDASFGKSH